MTTKDRRRVTKLVDNVGGVKQIHDELMAYSSRVELLESQRKQLTKKYPDKWVAMADGTIVAIANTLEKVLAEIDLQGISRKEAVIEFLDSKPKTMIL